jgi:hypothetical protein
MVAKGDRSSTCATRLVEHLPRETKLIIMFGLGAGGSYVATARKAIQSARPGAWRLTNMSHIRMEQ